MKKKLLVATLCIIVISPLFAQTPSIGYKIGDTGFGGGIVFLVQGNTYMEVSPILGEHRLRGAINAVRNYRGGGFSDWRLPTRDELNQIYQNLRRSGIGDLGDSQYWSSSKATGTSSHIWVQRFSDGRQSTNSDVSSNSVRAVRVFRCEAQTEAQQRERAAQREAQQKERTERERIERERQAAERERINRERREAEQNRIAW